VFFGISFVQHKKFYKCFAALFQLSFSGNLMHSYKNLSESPVLRDTYYISKIPASSRFSVKTFTNFQQLTENFTSHFRSWKASTVPVAGLMENAVPRSVRMGDQVKSAA